LGLRKESKSSTGSIYTKTVIKTTMPITTQDEEQTRLLLSLNIQSALKLKSRRDEDETEKFY